MAKENGLRVTASQLDFSGGVDSSRIPLFRSTANPHGLAPTELSWLESGTVRGGGITSREGLQPLVQGVKAWNGLYQGGFIYEPVNGNPQMFLDIGGKTYQIRVDTDNSVHDVTAGANPATVDYHWFCQAEEFLIIQDGVSVPLVWDGNVLRRITAMGGAAPYLPTGTAMAYQNGRVFVASGGRQYLIGDIVNGTANGTSNVLHAAENVLYPGGGGFIVPSNAGNIRGIAYTSNINQPVSVGTVFIGTRKAIYAFNGGTQRIPDAINNLGGWAQTPNLQTVAQYGNGFVNDRSIVGWNGDLFFQTLEPGVRSLSIAVRYSTAWGNVPISNNEQRILAMADRSLLRFASGIEFQNRILQTTLPFKTAVGVAHKGLMPLDFDIISSLEDRLSDQVFPAWEGQIEGLDFLQLFQGDFGGLQRAFAVVLSRVSNQIEVWEISQTKRDNGDARITFFAETGAFNWGDSNMLKELEGMDLWYDSLSGTVEIKVEYRGDGGCWNFWHQWRICSARNDIETGSDKTNYPTQTFCPADGLQALPKPVAPPCQGSVVRRPANIAYQFQVRITIKGNLRIRGFWLHALWRDKAPWTNMPC